MTIPQLGRLLLLLAMFSSTLFSFTHSALAAGSDTRLSIEVTPNEQQKTTVQKLHNNVRGAADLALPQLWHRIIPRHAHKQIPKKVKAVRFLQRATPTPEGVTVTFHGKRVFAWLKKNNIPYIEQQPTWNLELQLVNRKGKSMRQSAAMLKQYASQTSKVWGYSLQSSAPSLVLNWQWLDNRQVLLTVRGTSALGEYTDMRKLSSGDPVAQLKPWLSEVLLKARDGQVLPAADKTVSPVALTSITQNQLQIAPVSNDLYLILNIERQASLPEQILFEEELKSDPRILDLSLRAVNRENQQYRLHLKGGDDQWLVRWFSRRGLTLTATIEGWVAR